jgi:hypothetical protein
VSSAFTFLKRRLVLFEKIFGPRSRISQRRKKGEGLLRETFFDFFDFAVFRERWLNRDIDSSLWRYELKNQPRKTQTDADGYDFKTGVRVLPRFPRFLFRERWIALFEKIFGPRSRISQRRKKGEGLLRKTFFDFFDFAVFSYHIMAGV